MSRIFFTADLHLGHRLVAGLRGFDDPSDHDQMICDTWNRTVTDRDLVFVLGDIAMSDFDNALALLAGLPGEKHLVAGNHDPVHPMHHRGFSRNFKKFSSVFTTISPVRARKINGTRVMLSHFPFASWGDGPDRDGSRHDEWRVPDLGQPLLHGHTHGTERGHDNQFHVGWDAWGALVPEATVAAWLNNRTEHHP